MSKIRKDDPKLRKYYEQQGSCCFYCKLPISFSTVTRDHVYPRSKGGTRKDNTVFACKQCNGEKAAMTPEQFRDKSIKAIVKVLKQVVKQGFKIDQVQVDAFRRYHRIMKSTSALIQMNGKINFENK